MGLENIQKRSEAGKRVASEPSGQLEKGESGRQTALQELAKKSKMSIMDLNALKYFPGSYRGKIVGTVNGVYINIEAYEKTERQADGTDSDRFRGHIRKSDSAEGLRYLNKDEAAAMSEHLTNIIKRRDAINEGATEEVHAAIDREEERMTSLDPLLRKVFDGKG